MEFSYTPTALDWGRIAPELVIGATALLVLLVDLVLPASRRAWLAFVATLGVLGAGAAIGYLLATGNHGEAFFGMVTSDQTALFADAVVLTACGLAVFFSPSYIERLGITHQGEYYTLILLATGGMMLMASATNLLTIFAGLELLSLSLYILCAFVAGRFSSQEAGMKYFLLSSFASGFLLYGMALTYGATGATHLTGIRAFLDAHPFHITSGYGPLLAAGFALMAVGFAFKVSGVPFHAWTPDVYVGAPTSVTAFMSVGTKVAAFVALARVFLFALFPVYGDWMPIFWAVAVLSMIFGNILAVTQSDVKRMLAYSSVAHAGYILVGIVIGTSLGFSAVLVYLASYCVMNIGAFGVVLMLERGSGQGTTLADYAGLARRHPALAASLAICLLALAGVPPSAGFIGKYDIFYAAIVGGHLELAIIGLAASILGMFYYLRVIWAMYFTEPALVATPVPLAAEAPSVAGMPGGGPPAGALEPLAVSSGGAAVAISPSATRTTPAMTAAPAPAQIPVAATSLFAVPAAVLALTVAVVATVVIGIVPGPLLQFTTQAANALMR